MCFRSCVCAHPVLLTGAADSTKATTTLALAASASAISGQTTSSPQYETVRYTNDGLRLEAYLYRPAGPGPFPLVIHRHSGTDPAPRWGAVIARLLTDAGYAVLVPERRGTGNSEGQPFTEGGDDRDIARLRALLALKPAMSAAMEEVARGSASRGDIRRIAIMGYSAGGSGSGAAAACGDRFRAVITQAPSSVSWTIESGYHRPRRDAFAFLRYAWSPRITRPKAPEACVMRSKPAALLRI